MTALDLRPSLRNPLLVYQRHRDRIEDAAVAAVLMLLVGLFLEGMGVFEGQWRTVILVAIFGLGAQRRAWGYYAAIAALIWPLWLLSPYLMTLFLVVALLPRNWMIEVLPWALLVASAPLLAEWQIVALVPLLAGLVAGPTTGLWAGAAAALWLKLAGGLAGWMPPEMVALHGASFALELIRPNVAQANSLETLLLLAAPFAESSLLFLLHALQIALWGIAGWLVGRVRRLEWRSGQPQFPLVLALAPGALTLWAALYLVPAWLEVESLARFLFAPTPTVGLAVAALAAALLSSAYESVQRPVARYVRRSHTPTVRMSREGPVPVGGISRRGEHIRPERSPGDDDVIMLELD